MGLFDSLMKSASNAVKNETAKAVSNAASSVGKGTNRTESFTFSALPTNLAELQALPEASLDSAFKTTALTIAVLCAYENNPDACIEMLNFLKGPAEVSTYEKGFSIEKDGDVFVVSGGTVEYILDTTYAEDEESMRRFQQYLIREGIIEALRNAGATEDSTVRMGEWEFDFIE